MSQGTRVNLSTPPNLAKDVNAKQSISGSERTDVIGRDTINAGASERAKVSASYGISHIHYGVILPIKEKLIGLTDKQTENLKLYRTHVALCDQVDKVKSAYKAYRTAQKTADNAPLEPAIPRKGARQAAQAAGDKLVKSYDQLIELAVKKVDAHGLNKNDYLDDIQGKLGRGTKKYILKTVNQLRARMVVEEATVNHFYFGGGEPKIKGDYRNFMMDFVSYVHAANNASGGHVDLKEVSMSFIQGLASIPELAEGLILIDLYNQLNSTDFAKSIQNKQLEDVINHFSRELEKLINKSEDVTNEELKSIHCHGITLSSVLPTVTAEGLNDYRKTKKDHQEATQALEQAQSELAQSEGIIAGKEDYSFEAVEAFFQEIGEGKKALLEGVGTNTTAISRLAAERQTKAEDIKRLSGHIDKLKIEMETQAQTAKDEVAGCDKACVTAQAELLRLKDEIKERGQAQVKETAERDQLIKQYERYSKKEPDQKTNIFNDVLRKAAQELYEKKKSELAASIAAHQVEIEKKQDEHLDRLKFLDIMKAERLNLTRKGIADLEKAQKKISDVEAELQAKKTETMITLSGEDVAQIAKYLSVDNPISPASSIATTLSKTNAAYANVERLKKAIAVHEENIKQLSALEKSQSVAGADLFVEEKVKQRIEDQIASNFAIAKAVTLEVGREVIRQDDEDFKLQQPPIEKMTHQQQRHARRLHPLPAELQKIPEFQKVPDSKLWDKIQGRVQALPAVGTNNLVVDSLLIIDENEDSDSEDASHTGVSPSDSSSVGQGQAATQETRLVLDDEI